jgi:hypothetical protein
MPGERDPSVEAELDAMEAELGKAHRRAKLIEIMRKRNPARKEASRVKDKVIVVRGLAREPRPTRDRPAEDPEAARRRARIKRYTTAAPEERQPPPAVVGEVAQAALTLAASIRADVPIDDTAPPLAPFTDAQRRFFTLCAAERFFEALRNAERHARPTWASGKGRRIRRGESLAEYHREHFRPQDEPDGYAIETYGWMEDVPQLLNTIHEAGWEVIDLLRADDPGRPPLEWVHLERLDQAADRLKTILDGPGKADSAVATPGADVITPGERSVTATEAKKSAETADWITRLPPSEQTTLKIILDVLRTANRRLTTGQILTRDGELKKSITKRVLSIGVKEGLLTNDRYGKPPGYAPASGPT